MKRREFITLLGGAAAAWPLAARAQQPRQAADHRVSGRGTPAAMGQWTAAFVQRLRELGWIEGRTVAIEYRWAEGRTERFAEIAAEFVRLKVDVIVTLGNRAVPAAKQATSVIPIVFAVAGDPVGSGLVASLARPGGNVTGLSHPVDRSAGKRLDSCARLFPAPPLGDHGQCRQCPMPCWRWTRSRQRPARSALKSPRSKSGARRISRRPSRRSRAARGCALRRAPIRS